VRGGLAARVFATLAAVCMTVGLVRWPTVHWELGRAWAGGSDADRAAIVPIFTGLNSFLGTLVGEFVGELLLNLFFGLTAYAMLGSKGYPRWAGMAGLAARDAWGA
jgi:hypothetical protein